MKVELIYYPGKGLEDEAWFAARLLAFTKNTRLQMTPDGLAKFQSMSEAELEKEIAYMATSIPSSWEMADCIFAINGISRATAQQVTRTRTAVFAMQSQRVTDMSQVEWDSYGYDEQLDIFSSDAALFLHNAMGNAVDDYGKAVKAGIPLEDARDLLPIGVHCNLVAKYNLRTLVELVRSRERSLRVQGPYQEMVRLMREQVEAVWPWAHHFFADPHEKAREMLNEVARDLADKGAMYKGHAGTIAKALDLLSK